jgi:hypothetical protein
MKYNVPVYGNVTVEASSEDEAIERVKRAMHGELNNVSLNVLRSLEIGSDVYPL